MTWVSGRNHDNYDGNYISWASTDFLISPDPHSALAFVHPGTPIAVLQTALICALFSETFLIIKGRVDF